MILSFDVVALVWTNYGFISYTIKELHSLSPQANYTDRATAAC
jgi:hypothetical protein